MIIRFTKKTPTHHLFEVQRNNGSTEQAMLETRSYMPHDLIHFAYESLAGCRHSFYGRLAAGTTLADFREIDIRNIPETAEDRELVNTERITGPLTAWLRGTDNEEACLAMLTQVFQVLNESVPAHITAEFLTHLRELYRKLWGQWTSLPHHISMDLEWTIN